MSQKCTAQLFLSSLQLGVSVRGAYRSEAYKQQEWAAMGILILA